MPPAVGKSKSRGREQRQSRSRNTTPSSSVSAAPSSSTPSHPTFPDALKNSTDSSFDTILEKHGAGGGIPDPASLENISKDLKNLDQHAGSRSEWNSKRMRELVEKRKQMVEEELEREREQARVEAEEASGRVKRELEEDEERMSGRNKRKDRSVVRNERPPAVGAHGVARQDGLDLPLEGEWQFA